MKEATRCNQNQSDDTAYMLQTSVTSVIPIHLFNFQIAESECLQGGGNGAHSGVDDHVLAYAGVGDDDGGAGRRAGVARGPGGVASGQGCGGLCHGKEVPSAS